MNLNFGIILNLLKIPPVSPILKSFKLISDGAIPIALFAIGGVLVDYDIKASLKKILIILLLFLILHPFFTYLLAHFTFKTEIEII